ncbi:MAG: TatD family hydrolase [Lachnospiraceae bacterium]|nr:TatD family hydrolase [Lachnospiraceae bacterium]
MRIFDTHAHYDDDRFASDIKDVMESLKEAGVLHFTNISSDLPSVDKTLEIIKDYPQAYGALGIHPSELIGLEESDMEEIERKLRNEPRAVAVGEIGLDYHYDDGPDKELQKTWFRRQLDMARDTGKPVVIHSRDAAADTYEVLKEAKAEEFGGVIHCYSGSPEMAEDYVKMGFFIGIGGTVTFKNAKKVKEVVRRIPLSNIVLETDCPYLAPTPHRGKRNDSHFLPLVVAEIARLKEISEEQVAETTWENAFRLFRIPC